MRHSRVFAVLVITAALLGAAGSFTNPRADCLQEKDGIRDEKPMVTFIELGSVKCIPCRKMQPVMESIGTKYGAQVSVVFYDVWKAEQRHYAERYGIRVIPTQVFLDKDGKEFFRHEGFFPETEIDKLLKKQGLKTRSRG